MAKENIMDKDEAIEYLQDKGHIKEKEVKLTKSEAAKVKDVMKHGKIYGDPCVQLF